jgi:hypothetical protein
MLRVCVLGFRAGGNPVNFKPMKLTTFLACGIAVLSLAGRAGAQGQDQFVYGISGGVMIPSGLGGDNHKLGPQGAVMVGIGSVDSPFGVRLDVMYGGLGAKTGTGTLGLGAARVTNVSGDFLFRLIGQDERLYFVGGAGGYNYNPDGAMTRATNDFAINAGLGIWLPGFNGFVEARWFNMYRALPDPVSGLRGKKSLRIYPISVGLMF